MNAVRACLAALLIGVLVADRLLPPPLPHDNAGMVVVADGTPEAAKRLERVLTSDPGMGVIRHADAGYQRAIDVADERGVRIPMREG